MQDSNNSYHSVIFHLRRLRRRALLLDVGAALLLGLALEATLLLAWVSLEALFYLAPPWRSAFGLAAGLGFFAAVSLYLARKLPGHLSFKRLGLHLESCSPELQQRLISTLELWQNRRAHQLYSEDLLRSTVDDACATLASLEPRRIFTARDLVVHGRWLGLVVLFALGWGVLFTESFTQALHRCSNPLTVFARPPATLVDVVPGDMEIIKGEDAVLTIHFSGKNPRTATVSRREGEAAPWQEEEIIVDGVDSLAYTFKEVKRTLSYQVRAGDGYTRPHWIRVIDPPAIRRLRLKYRYPAYSGLSPRIDEENGDIAALPGTTVDIEIAASKPLSRAALVLDDSLSMPARIEDQRAYAHLVLDRNGRYHLELTDLDGAVNPHPIRYSIRAIDDLPPRVSITEPGRDMDLTESMQVVMALEATDDYGISRLALVYRVNEGPEEQRHLAVPSSAKIHSIHRWDLGSIDLLPDDLVHYRVVAFDNDQVSGPKMGSSREYVLRYPSLHQLVSEAGSDQDEQLGGLEELAADSPESRAYLEEVRRRLLNEEKLSWGQKKELEAILDHEEQRARSVAELAREMEETMGRLEDDGLASEKLLDKLEEVRQLLAEVTTPELQEALMAVQQAMDRFAPPELAEALKEFRKDQEAFEERLDRAIDLLKQVRAEQRLEAAVQLAVHLERRQVQINTRFDLGADRENLQRQENSLRGDTELLQGELQELGRDMEKFGPGTSRKLQRQAEAMEEQDLSGRMEEMAERMQDLQEQDARRLGSGLEDDLGVLSANLQQLRDEYGAMQKDRLTRQIGQAIHELLRLSHDQENLRARTGAPLEQASTALAHDQFALMQGTGQVVEGLAKVGRETMSLSRGLNVTLGYVLRTMRQAADQLGQRDWSAASTAQRESMGYLNESVLLLRESLENLARSRMPSTFGEAMQKMLDLAEKQGNVNQSTRKVLGAQGRQTSMGGHPEESLSEEIARLAAEQRRIYQALAQLERDMRGHRGAQKRIQAIEEEMDSVLRDLERSPDRRTLDKQNRILQRMLDASRSIHTRGFDDKRRATRAGEHAYTGPNWLPDDLGQSFDFLRQAMKHALDGPYPEEYQARIQDYYERVYQDAIGRESGTVP